MRASDPADPPSEMPPIEELPEPAIVSVRLVVSDATRETALFTVRAFAESFVQVCDALSERATCSPAVCEPIVTAPAEEPTESVGIVVPDAVVRSPAQPSDSVRLVPPADRVTASAVVNESARVERSAAPSVTACVLDVAWENVSESPANGVVLVPPLAAVCHAVVDDHTTEPPVHHAFRYTSSSSTTFAGLARIRTPVTPESGCPPDVPTAYSWRNQGLKLPDAVDDSVIVPMVVHWASRVAVPGLATVVNWSVYAPETRSVNWPSAPPLESPPPVGVAVLLRPLSRPQAMLDSDWAAGNAIPMEACVPERFESQLRLLP